MRTVSIWTGRLRGYIIEVLLEKDGCVRLVRLKTVKVVLLRPVQRLYHLECSLVHEPENESSSVSNVKEPLAKLSPPEENTLLEASPQGVEKTGSAGIKSRVPVTVTCSGRMTKLPIRLLDYYC